jgi:bifunctional oligoribonuclease and PAP phosphatase NrnA
MTVDSMLEAAKTLRSAESVLLVSHIRPDGDAVGSLLGLGLALQKGGKRIQMVLADGVPAQFRHLPGSEAVLHRPDGAFDVVCLLDCSDAGRAGVELDGNKIPDINIDHHITNLRFARINLVDTSAVATAEILAELVPLSSLLIDNHVAATLLTGIITDTIGFQTNNMTPKALRLAAELMEAGADISGLYHKALSNRSFEALHLWGAGLSRVERDDRMIWTTLTMEDRKQAKYPGRDDADLINVLSGVDNADVYMIFVEQPKGKVKVSWRSQIGFDVTPIASSFGGGGHPSASGAEIKGELTDVRNTVLSATRSFFSGHKE